MSHRGSGRMLLRWWPVLVVAAVVLMAAGIIALSLSIQSGAHESGRAAQREFPGDEVEALVALVGSEHHSLYERNHAVWALGQLRDARALPVLAKFYTGRKCEHDKFLCQSELKKAIDGCSGRTFSVPAWVARVLRAGT